MYSTRYSFQILKKVRFSQQIFEKCSNIRFHSNPSSGKRVVPSGQMDKHDEANSCFSQLCEQV